MYEYVKLVFVAAVIVVISVLMVVQARLEDRPVAAVQESVK